MKPKKINAEQIATELLFRREQEFEAIKPENRTGALVALGIVTEMRNRSIRPGVMIEAIAQRVEVIPTAQLIEWERDYRHPHKADGALCLLGIETALQGRVALRADRGTGELRPQKGTKGAKREGMWAAALRVIRGWIS